MTGRSYEPGANKYGYGLHTKNHDSCPNCSRNCEPKHKRMYGRFVACRKCYWCNQPWHIRMINNIKRRLLE